jgi:hypothetical protein
MLETQSPENTSLLLDDFLPTYDVKISKHATARVPAAAAYRTACELDLLTVKTPVLTAAFWVRGLPDRIRRRTVEVPPRLSIRDGGLPAWMVLGERPGRELSFGVVGRFWKPTIEWRAMTAQQFPGFSEPGWGKIACSFVVKPDDPQSSVVTYECRVATTDPGSRRRFAWYWRLIRPFVGHIMNATVETIVRQAESAPTEDRRPTEATGAG